MCLEVRRHYNCGHKKVLTIQCAATRTLASMVNTANESSSNIPSLSDDHAMITRFLLTQCMKQCDLPTEEQRSSKLCGTCNETPPINILGSDRDFSDTVQFAIGMNDNKPMKWTDENGNVWDVRDEAQASRPPPPPKNGAHDSDEREKRVRPSEMSLFESINFRWTDKEGNELTTRDEKQLLAREKPRMFAAMKTPGQRRSISSLNAQYQSAMHESFLATTPEKNSRPWPNPNSAQRAISTGSGLLSAFQSMTSNNSLGPPSGPTPKRSLVEKTEYYADKVAAGMPESPKTVDEARKKYEADRDAAKNADMTIEEWKKWKDEAEQAAAEHDSMTSPLKTADRVKMRVVDRSAFVRCGAINDRIHDFGASKMSSSTASAPGPTIDDQKATAKDKITSIVLKLASEALTPDPDTDDNESSTEKRRIRSTLHTAVLSAMKNISEESVMSTPKTSGDYQSASEEESAASFVSSADESIISTPEADDQDTIIAKKSASSVIGSDNDSIIFSSTAAGKQRIISNKKSPSGLLSTVQEEGPSQRPTVANLQAKIAAVKNKLASMPPTVIFSDDEDKEADALEVMPKSKKKRIKAKAKKGRDAAAVEVAPEADKKFLNSILEPTRVQKLLEENKKAYNARVASLATSSQALKDFNDKYPFRQGDAKPAEETNSTPEDWPPGGAPVPWTPAAPGHEVDGLKAAFAAARIRIAACKAAEDESPASAPASASASTEKPGAPRKRRLGQKDELKLGGPVGSLAVEEKKVRPAFHIKPTFDDQTATDQKGAFEVIDISSENTSSGPGIVNHSVAEKNLAPTQQPVAEGQTVAEKISNFSKLATQKDSISSVPQTAHDAVDIALKVTAPSSPETRGQRDSPSGVNNMSSPPEDAAVADADIAAASSVNLPSSPWIPDY